MSFDVLAIGEPLAEFTAAEAADETAAEDPAPALFARRLGGDTLNAAVYLARLRPDLRVGYLTRLGDDWMSGWMRDAIAAEGVDVSAIAVTPGGRPGLSFIRADARGERSFAYWRDHTPARGLFAEGAPELAALSSAQAILFSGVGLAILTEAARHRLLAALHRAAAGGATVIYDTNYRARLWPSRAVAAGWSRRALAVASLALPSLEDLEALWPARGAEAALAACRRHSAGHVVMTTGGSAVLHSAPGAPPRAIALPPPVPARDTTAAGDSFNAGFLASWLRDGDIGRGVRAGARLAARVVQHPGAIIPRAAMAEEIAADGS